MDHLYYRNGALYCAIHPDKKEYFYEDGTPKTIEKMRDGRLEGECLLYWPNGKLKRKCHFIRGMRHGLDQMWNEEGTLIDEGHYELGKPVGIHHRFSKQGKLIEEIEYLEGPRFNLRQWDEQGELRVEALWTDSTYREKVWDRFQNVWVEKEGFWNGKKLVYV